MIAHQTDHVYERQVPSNILPPNSCIWRFPLKVRPPPLPPYRVPRWNPSSGWGETRKETKTERERETLTPKNRIHLPERWCTRRGSRALSSPPTRSRLAALEPRGKKKKKRAKNRKEGGLVDSSVLAVVRVSLSPLPPPSPLVTNVDRVRGRGDKTRSCLGAWRGGW